MKEIGDKDLHCRFKKATWDKVEKAKKIYLEAIKDTDLAQVYVNNLMVNKAVDIFYSDNVLEEISLITGLKPKVINISEWIKKNWNKIKIDPYETDDCIYHLHLDYLIDFDITVEVVRDGNDEVHEIILIKDCSNYIPGVVLEWDIQDLDVLADYLK